LQWQLLRLFVGARTLRRLLLFLLIFLQLLLLLLLLLLFLRYLSAMFGDVLSNEQGIRNLIIHEKKRNFQISHLQGRRGCIMHDA
jgi:hypothetical protein